MDFQALKTEYIAKHWRSIDDTAKAHLNGFAAHCEAALAKSQAEAEPEAEAPAEADPAA